MQWFVRYTFLVTALSGTLTNISGMHVLFITRPIVKQSIILPVVLRQPHNSHHHWVHLLLKETFLWYHWLCCYRLTISTLQTCYLFWGRCNIKRFLFFGFYFSRISIHLVASGILATLPAFCPVKFLRGRFLMRRVSRITKDKGRVCPSKSIEIINSI